MCALVLMCVCVCVCVCGWIDLHLYISIVKTYATHAHTYSVFFCVKINLLVCAYRHMLCVHIDTCRLTSYLCVGVWL